jgi:ribosomal-protein-alanine N-acetyltransferase
MQHVSQGKIVRASAADIGDFIRLGEAENLSPWSAQNYLDELKLSNSVILKLASEYGELLGFVVGRVVESTEASRDAEIYNIAVTASAKQKGCGQALFDAFRREAVGMGAATFWLEVRESNHPARSFYRKNGFVPVQTRQNFYNNPTENAILMKLDLRGDDAESDGTGATAKA